jgi:riboflavin kinase/FMN adenylyltransferase
MMLAESRVHADDSFGMAMWTLHWIDPAPAEVVGGAITIGNFDGVHRGHADLVAKTRNAGRPAVAISFDPPPAALLRPNLDKSIPLTTLSERSELLQAAGADHVVILKTDAGLLALSPEAFFEDVIVRMFQAVAVVEGYNFRFGRGRTGNNSTLRTLCKHSRIAFIEAAPVLAEGEPISSSRVRAELVAGNVSAAANLLGRCYHIRGIVETGAKRGRTIGFPTANIGSVPTLVPASGVYAVWAVLPDGTRHPAAANIGSNPTFGDDARKIEVHLIDYVGDLYGQSLAVEFVARLRDTVPFRGPAELVEQLKQDVAAARTALS